MLLRYSVMGSDQQMWTGAVQWPTRFRNTQFPERRTVVTKSKINFGHSPPPLSKIWLKYQYQINVKDFKNYFRVKHGQVFYIFHKVEQLLFNIYLPVYLSPNQELINPYLFILIHSYSFYYVCWYQSDCLLVPKWHIEKICFSIIRKYASPCIIWLHCKAVLMK